MGRERSGIFHSRRWTPPSYTVDDQGKIVGGYVPTGPHNWGRWGADDRRGTANFLSASAVVEAAKLVRRGVVFSLALSIDDEAPVWEGRTRPKHYFSMTGSDGIAGLPHSALEPGVTFTDDYIDMPLQASTQWDGLGHWAYEDSLYNGYWAGNITSSGSPDLEMSAMKESFVGRGVLLDVARQLGRGPLEPGFAITPQLIEATIERQQSPVVEGDIVLVRTGHLGRWYTHSEAADRTAWSKAVPGLSREMVPWLAESKISALAIDTMGVEVVPNETPIDRPHPIHHAALIDLGLTLGELWWLDDLASDCADDGRYEFLLSAPPLNIPGAIGTVLNPIAIK
ncbi:cyclase family protein [Rhodococcus sp. 114MFTsu3.1]|uniref:cyclase family protein n=1 Tax=Rhodococcus sp. 114MFTsu3.1 TaxID=1172184 RepID=UPI00048117D2|nr:cyclase family protein [Rhodococcus sp. 114MFTsu3.1]